MQTNPSHSEVTPNQFPAIWDLVVSDVENTMKYLPENKKGLTRRLIMDIQARDQIHQQTFGGRLRPHNGRNPLNEAYQELLEAIAYVRQYGYENPSHMFMINTYKEMLSIAYAFRALMDKTGDAEKEKNNHADEE